MYGIGNYSKVMRDHSRIWTFEEAGKYYVVVHVTINSLPVIEIASK